MIKIFNYFYSMRRPRNIRFSNSLQYNVVNKSHVDESHLEIYKSTSLKTGLETDEEKEYHFKNIMIGKTDTIFIPLIEKIEIKPKGKPYKLINEFLEKEKDIELSIFTSLEIESMAKKLELEPKIIEKGIKDRKELNKLINNIGETKSPETIDLIMTNTINTSDLDDLCAKLCYRNRKIMTIRKGRKNDSFVLEKIVKFNTELDILYKTSQEQLKDIYTEINEIKNEREMLYTLIDYFKDFKRIKKKRILKDIYNNHVLDSNIKIYQSVKSFQDLIYSPEKMAIVIQKLNNKINKKEAKRIKVQAEFLKSLFNEQ